MSNQKDIDKLQQEILEGTLEMESLRDELVMKRHKLKVLQEAPVPVPKKPTADEIMVKISQYGDLRQADDRNNAIGLFIDLRTTIETLVNNQK